MIWDDWFWLVFGIIGFAITAVDLHQRRAAGPVLLDLGRRTYDYSNLVTLLLLMAFLYTRLRLHVDVWFPLFGIVGLGTCSITGLTRRRQIREADCWAAAFGSFDGRRSRVTRFLRSAL